MTEIQTRVLRGAEPAKMLRQTIASAKTLFEDQSGTSPTLATLLVGSDAAALAYRASIERTFKKVEIAHRKVELPTETTNSQLARAIQALNNDPDVTGILVLMPLPKHLDPHVVLENISPLKDVDGISPVNAGRLHLGLPSLKPSTPAGGLELLRYYGVDLCGANVAVVGRSNVVGRPLSTMLSHANATVTLCHSKTKNLSQHLRRAEIVCVAAGKPGLVTGRMVRKGALVLDFGVNVTADGKVVGDSDIASLEGIASAITPTPGGTGPVTAMVLARNVLAAGFAQLEGTLDALQELEAMLQCPLPDISEFLEPIQLQD
ncbi:MAG: bifunctional 5,10-methylenetetrahydrofolate dehydrogenase/5,10-methenyltetrahydrofolate cyclohydrolase [Thermomicrobiales bacterium]|nr:bifunctional 5,10-methylenetetrahydrofolate dehydrogenase/5,10-methenyltetrahydrofolate cyclohydrolase [Thermomicrobiales bacterium]